MFILKFAYIQNFEWILDIELKHIYNIFNTGLDCDDEI